MRALTKLTMVTVEAKAAAMGAWQSKGEAVAFVGYYNKFGCMQGVPQKTWGVTYHGFLEFGGPRGWLAGLEGG